MFPAVVLFHLNAGSPISAAPAVARDGTTFVGTAEGSLEAWDDRGVLRWSFMLEGAPAFAPLIDASDRVYVATTERLYAFSTNGVRQWELKTPAHVVSELAAWPPWGVLFDGSDGSVWAVSPRARLLWHTELHATLSAGPTVRGDREVVGATTGDVFFMQGAARRSTSHLNGAVRGAPAFFGDGSAAVIAGDALYGLDARGSIRWHHDGVTWMVAGGAGLFAVDAHQHLLGLSRDGQVVSDTPLGVSVSAPPSVSPRGMVYVPTDSGALLRVDPGRAGGTENISVTTSALHRPVVDASRHRIVVASGGGEVAAVEADE